MVESAESPSGWSVAWDDRLDRALSSLEDRDKGEGGVASGTVTIVAPEEVLASLGPDAAQRLGVSVRATVPAEAPAEAVVPAADLAAVIEAISVARPTLSSISLSVEDGHTVIRIVEDEDSEVIELDDR